jgi:hypothetical protein
MRISKKIATAAAALALAAGLLAPTAAAACPYTVGPLGRYIAPGRQIIVAPSTRTPGGWQVTFYHADRQTGELVPIGHADRDTAAGVADEIPYNYIAADAVA